MASGETLREFLPLNMEPPSSDAAAIGHRNAHPILGFRDDTVNEIAIFSALMPQHYGGGGVTVFLHYAMATATSGDVDWDVSFERIGDQQQDIDSDNFAAANSVDDTTVPGTSGDPDVVSVAFTDGADMASVAKGELFRIKIVRDALSDTAAGDAQLLAVEMRET